MKKSHHKCKVENCKWNENKECHCNKLIEIDGDGKCTWYKMKGKIE